MPPLSLGALFGLGVGMNAVNQIMSIPTGLINQAFYKRNLELQTQAQKDLIDYQNEYNKPSAQMQRLAEAGLNPNLVYGSAAPPGQSGNAAAPAGHSPSGWNTSDVAGAMLQMAQMKQAQSTINLQESAAEKNRAEARFTSMQADRYNELIDQQLREASQRIDESASRIGLNESSVQLQSAQKMLAVAEEAYRRGEIGLQQFRKNQIIAQTALYTSQKELSDTENYYRDVEGQMELLELQYQKYFMDANGGPKSLAEAERNALQHKFEYDAKKIAATIGIEGSKTTQWISWITSELGKILGGTGMAAFGAGMVRRGRVMRVSGLQ